MAVDKDGRAISVGDKVMIKAMRIEGRVVATGPDTVDVDIGETLPRRGVAAGPGFSAVVKMDAVSMAYGESVSVGDRVRVWMGPGSTPELRGLVTELRGNLVIVRGDDGQSHTADKSEVSKMSRQLDAVDLAFETRCPYCTSKVALHARTLGDHRTHGGPCDGSGRRVAEFDYAGRAVLEAQTFAGYGDPNHKYRPGDRIVAVNAIYEGAEGEVVRDLDTGVEWRVTSNSRCRNPEYAPVGQVLSTRKGYMAPA